MPGFEVMDWFYEKACWVADNYKVILGTVGMVAGLGMGIWIGYRRDHPKPNPFPSGERRGSERELERNT